MSEFWALAEGEFGSAYAHTLVREYVLTSLGSRTAQEALAGGVAPREVWLAMCADLDVPPARRFGPDHRPAS